MKKYKRTLIDFYLRYPIIIDFIIFGIALFFIYKNQSTIDLRSIEAKFDTIISNLISSIVSFAGFILASLTIIVTFKANIKIRKLEEAQNSLELLLASDNYKSIITVFKDSIIELVLCLFLLYIFWTPVFPLSLINKLALILYGLIVIIFTVARTLFILFKIIFLEFPKKRTL